MAEPEIGQGSWRIPECWPENRNPTPVPDDERCPFGPPAGQGSGDCTGPTTQDSVSFSSTQEPTTGTQVETKGKYQTNQTKEPQPTCPGGCNCTPGETKIVNKESKGSGKKETVKIKLDIKNVSCFCKCDGKDGKPLSWYEKCEDTTMDVEAEAEILQETWDEVYEVSCDCQSQNCNCSESYTVTTSYAREYYKVPTSVPPKKIPGCECGGAGKDDCPQPCDPGKQVEHNYGKCKGCGGYH